MKINVHVTCDECQQVKTCVTIHSTYDGYVNVCLDCLKKALEELKLFIKVR